MKMILALSIGLILLALPAGHMRVAANDTYDLVFSHEAGFFAAEFDLVITSEAGVVRYTLDGSFPTVDSPIFPGSIRIHSSAPTLANSPMSAQGVGRAYGGWRDGGYVGWVDHFVPRLYYNGMVVRAASVFCQDTGRGTNTQTKSFFVERDGRGTFNTRVLSLVMEPQHFIDPYWGIYRNWDSALWWYQNFPGRPENFGSDGPRHIANAEMFYTDGSLMFSQNANTWVAGNWSRRHPQRSIRMNFNQGDGDITDMPQLIPNTFRHFYAPQEYIGTFRHLNARVSDMDHTSMRETIVHLLSEPLRPTIQNSTYGAVFINGEFWGMYCLRAHRNTSLISELYGVRSSSVQLTGDWHTYEHIYTHIRDRDMSSPSAFEEMDQYIDMDNFIDYMIIGYHFENWDWLNNNFEFWRTTRYYPGVHGGDGRWRFVIQDFDSSLFSPASDEAWYNGVVSNNMMDIFTTPGGSGISVPTRPWVFGSEELLRDPWVTDMVQRLFENEEFRNKFAARYSTYTGTVFHPSRAINLLNTLTEERIDTMGAHLHRWGYHNATTPTDGMDSWLYWGWEVGSIQGTRNVMNRRGNYALQHLRDYFNQNSITPASFNLDLDTSGSGFTNIRWMTDDSRGWFDISGAQIRADLFQRYGMTGYTFGIGDFNANYMREMPITATANALDGYYFSHFVVAGDIDANIYENPAIIVPPRYSQNITVTAVFNRRVQSHITIHGGGDGAFASPNPANEGAYVTLNPGIAPAGKAFVGWTSYDVDIVNPYCRKTAHFEMICEEVSVTATFDYKVMPPPSVIIHQVHGHGSPGANSISHGFIELVNPTGQAVCLDEYSLQVSLGVPDGAGPWEVLCLSGRSIGAYSSFLIVSTAWYNDGSGGGHVPRYIITNFDMGWNLQFCNRNMAVALVDGKAPLSDVIRFEQWASIIDLVGVLNEIPVDFIANYLGSGAALRSWRQGAARRIDFQNTRDNASDFHFVDFRYPTGYEGRRPGIATHNNGITNQQLANLRPRYSGDGSWAQSGEITYYFTCLIFRDYIRARAGIGPGGRIFAADVTDINSIRVAGMGITSLDGIQHLPSITLLFAPNNNFGGGIVDLRSNILLTNIVVQNSNIGTLRVDGLAHLVHLNASNNGLHTLNVTGAHSLRGLSISRNQLASVIGLETLGALKVFWAEENQFAAINLSGHKNLVKVDVSGNNLIEGTTAGSGIIILPPQEYFNRTVEHATNLRQWMRARIARGLRV